MYIVAHKFSCQNVKQFIMSNKINLGKGYHQKVQIMNNTNCGECEIESEL